MPARSPSAPDSPAVHLDALRAVCARGPRVVPLETRRGWLDALAAALVAHQDTLADAVSADYGHRGRHETLLADVFASVHAARTASAALEGWAAPRPVSLGVMFKSGTARIEPTPLGVVGIISPWNYPILLALSPMVGALAAGNRVLLKPSEFTPRTANALAAMLRACLGDDVVRVVQGGPDVGAAFAGLPVDHLLFTGGAAVARHVARAAAENLVPTTLELGGKSPAVVLPGADLGYTIGRLVTGKMMNAGQTCIAPDYVLAPASSLATLVGGFQAAVVQRYGADLDAAEDYAAILQPQHRARLDALVKDATDKGARAHVCGQVAEGSRKMAPVLLTETTPDMRVRQEEIFGPVLPLIACADERAAAAHIGGAAPPLALYAFGEDKSAIARLLAATQSGGVCVNDTLVHVAAEELPFGGVGQSGYGRYHGQAGFDTFSHLRSVYVQRKWNAHGLMGAPYGPAAKAMIKTLLGTSKLNAVVATRVRGTIRDRLRAKMRDRS